MLDQDVEAIINSTRTTAGAMFCAVGAKALTEDSVLIGFIERSHKAEKEKRAKLIKA